MTKHMQRKIRLIVNLNINRNNLQSLADSGTGYNVIDRRMLGHLHLQFKKFQYEMFLKTVSGGQLPIIGKLTLHCIYNGKDFNLLFLVSKYALSYTKLGRRGLDIFRPG